ncbi:MAG: flagellar assembly protein FliH [Zoogloeaceae bacterium]|jgi:flagellar assembly protein FliH|nr:flagellar assembly protein FliH [Zoogloeaceae bacterium]
MAGQVISREEQAEFRRWQAEDFSVAAPPSLVPQPPAPNEGAKKIGETVEVTHVGAMPLPTAQEIERIHEEARESGYRNGLEQGLAEGREQGRGEGYPAGYAEGQKQGEADGRESGYKEGRAEGYQKGREEGGEAARRYEEELRRLAQGFGAALAALDQEVAEATLACALEAARQMTRVAFTAHPEPLLALIREALAALPLRHSPVTLFLSPADAALARERLSAVFPQETWRIQEDAALTPGGFLMRADASEVDARVESRWRRILEGIGLSPEWLEHMP